ncbi:MAG: beta-ketoacyl synthase chain length factor [Stellaceae bacterium]
MKVYVEGIGVWAAGLDGWTACRDVLTGKSAYEPAPLALPPSPLLPPNERRRTVATVRLALQVGAEAFAHAGRDPSLTATVFTSSGGDGETLHGILESLNSSELDVSPMRFHNSVHNAPAGYWTIATHSREPSTSLCAFDASFSAGLLDAVAQAAFDDQAVALIAYDLPYPEPLHSVRAIGTTFAVALVLTPKATPASLGRLTLALGGEMPAPTKMADPALEGLRRGNPAARSLPLLQALARGDHADLVLEHVNGNRVAIAVAPPPW